MIVEANICNRNMRPREYKMFTFWYFTERGAGTSEKIVTKIACILRQQLEELSSLNVRRSARIIGRGR